MDGADLTTPAPPMELGAGGGQTSSSRPSLGFPLGTALLLIVIFCLSGVFSCCYHWDKLRSLRGHSQNHVHEADRAGDHHLPPPLLVASPLTLKLASNHLGYKQEKDQLSLPVIMPGDRIPKFIAWPCPCQVPPSSNLPQAAAPDHQKIILEEV